MKYWLLFLAMVLAGCTAPAGRQVVVYTSVDQVQAEPVLRGFESATGIRVLPVYDVEAAKTTGLVNRLVAEKARPLCDVFWNGEFAQTLELGQRGLLQPYRPAAAQGLPEHWRDECWTATGGRARLFLVHQGFARDLRPRGLEDLLKPGPRVAMANPLFGTAATHAAALYALWGRPRAREFYARLKARGVRVVDGNSVVRDLVVAGQLDYGLTDSDDACGALERGAEVALCFPDQGQGEQGTLVVPGSLALVAGAPHAAEGRQLIDYLLSTEVEIDLMRRGWSQIPLRPLDLPKDLDKAAFSGIRPFNLSPRAIMDQMERARQDMRELFGGGGQ